MVDASSGQDYPVRFEIVEMAEPDLLLLESPPAPEWGIPERVTTRVAFEEDGEWTTVTVTQAPHTEEMFPRARQGWTTSLEKLSALIGKRGTASP